MAGEASTQQVLPTSKTHLAQLKDGGQRGYIVVKIVRLWDCIIPPSNTFTGIDFLAGFAMHGTIPSDLADDFRSLFKEGKIYKIRIFEVGPRMKKTHIVVPLETLLFFNVSTMLDEVTDYIERIPGFYFNFASYDQVMQRNEKTYHMTDLIGILQGATDVKPIVLSNNRGSVDKRDIFFILLSGEKLKITLWDPKLMDLNITDVIRLGYKPVLALGRIYIKDNQGGNKQFNSCSGTKFYLDPQIPQAAEVRAKFPVDGRPIELISSADADANQEYTYPDAVEKTIQDLLYMNSAVIKGLKFKVRGKVLQFQTKQGWYYTSCRDCTYGVKPTPSGYRCDNGHGITPKKMSLRVSLIIIDDLTIAEKLDTKNIPAIANKILNKEFEFILGISDQTYTSGLNFKIFRFTPLADEIEALSGSKMDKKDSSHTDVIQEVQTEVICTPHAEISPCGTETSLAATHIDELNVSGVKPTQSAAKKMKTCARKINFK
ncbi:Nucleic acid-binding protein [Corchorus olitorius]|uniref:Nucleic acid-binding protein n=1 Tax=Corchorus olitorius TaxID=93759 RepID=A0A1R3GA42_9ROSI|nr:Nucleic acid-binding protein [Corchorus olitorius]